MMALQAWLRERRLRAILREVEPPFMGEMHAVASPTLLQKLERTNLTLLLVAQPFADWEALSVALPAIKRALRQDGRFVALLEPQADTALKESETALRLLSAAGFQRVVAYRTRGFVYVSAHKSE